MTFYIYYYIKELKLISIVFKNENLMILYIYYYKLTSTIFRGLVVLFLQNLTLFTFFLTFYPFVDFSPSFWPFTLL